MQRLMHIESGRTIDPGTTIHVSAGTSAGKAWRYEKITPCEDGHKIHCTRSHPKLGRIHREFTPSLFGCTVVIDVAFYADRARMLSAFRRLAVSGVGALVAAIIAWVVAEYGNSNLQSVLALVGAR
ncbi:hypothetical protein [Streptantibioticus silvisoli]|uniref:Uncharacterized protein n=1 Tax=Streptantibioticus silvisoli TaxID=2705255 RepID=A0ABT6VZZ0_9ACTN|nr:hypothetical protein [Streptantibioticus silvisoli]MDI5964063.1 hypothetical protein [Streptantibioticus silvisoli]